MIKNIFFDMENHLNSLIMAFQAAERLAEV